MISDGIVAGKRDETGTTQPRDYRYPQWIPQWYHWWMGIIMISLCSAAGVPLCDRNIPYRTVSPGLTPPPLLYSHPSLSPPSPLLPNFWLLPLECSLFTVHPFLYPRCSGGSRYGWDTPLYTHVRHTERCSVPRSNSGLSTSPGVLNLLVVAHHLPKSDVPPTETLILNK